MFVRCDLILTFGPSISPFTVQGFLLSVFLVLLLDPTFEALR